VKIRLDPSRATTILAESHIDALVATTKANFLYVTGLQRELPFVTRTPVAAIVGGSPLSLQALVMPRIEAPGLVDCALIPERAWLYGDFQFAFSRADALSDEDNAVREILVAARQAVSFESALVQAVEATGLAEARIGWDDLNIARDIRECVSSEDIDARDTWRRIRQIKTPREIEQLARVAKITEEIELCLIELCHAGRSWNEIRTEFEFACVRGGVRPGFWSSGGGRYSSMIVDKSPGTLHVGDLVRFDFGCVGNQYWSDTGRTVAVGEPSPLAKRRYQALQRGLEAGWEAVRPGVEPASVFYTVIDVIHKAGFPSYARHHVGHSIGIELYDGCFVAPGTSEPFEEGMVVNLEVPYYEVGWGGMQIEDTAVITEGGVSLLTSMSREMFVSEDR
jgi:Xaa-Pro dipeptidase